MANERNRTDDQFSGPTSERQEDSREDRMRDSYGDEEVRGVADESDEEFEDMEDLEEDEDDGSI